MGDTQKKRWVMLENNPEVMDQLASTLGLSAELRFYDVYSFDEPELLSHIPRPALALLAIIPWTPSWDRDRRAEDAEMSEYEGSGPGEPVIWFKQTIGNACGSIGLLHCAINGPAAQYIESGSDIDKICHDAIPLKMAARAQMLYDSLPFERAHQSVENVGDTEMIPAAEHVGQHFVAFVKVDGKLWELEGARKGPLLRGTLGDDEDVLSPRALDLGLGRILRLQEGDDANDLRFSCIALAHKS